MCPYEVSDGVEKTLQGTLKHNITLVSPAEKITVWQLISLMMLLHDSITTAEEQN